MLFVHQQGSFDGETVGFGGFVHGKGCFVEKREIAGRAGNDEKDQGGNDGKDQGGNDGKDQGGNDGKVEPAMTEGDDEHKKSSRDFSLLL